MALLALVLMGVGCKDEDDPTTAEIEFSVFGVEQASTGYINGEFVDGWEVHFDKWVTVFGGVTAGGEPVTDSLYAVDWVKMTEPVSLGKVQLGAGEHAVGFQTAAATDAVVPLTEVDDGTLSEMIQRNYTHSISGWGENGGSIVYFSWGMSNPAVYTDCVNGETELPGISISDEDVEEQASLEAEVTFHLDHHFYDWLDTEAAEMRFEVFYAWANPVSFVLVWEDLYEINAASITDRDGDEIEDEDGHDLSYSNAGLPFTDYLLYSVQSMAHLNGVGICEFDDAD